uniref:Uncharacterized protein n=1 Tax=Athene cunicularia TaxID=194338 RepID=A0A663LU65_ATHCN
FVLLISVIINPKSFYPPLYRAPLCSQIFSIIWGVFVSFAQCLWCYTNNTCIDYPVRSILPSSSLCSLSNARWGVCWRFAFLKPYF